MATRSLSKNHYLHVLPLIDQYAPRRYRTTGNPRSRYTMKCPLCEHESSTGVDAYFTVTDDQQLFHCFVCGEKGNAQQLLLRLNGQAGNASPPRIPRPPHRNPTSGPERQQRQTFQGATIHDLALAKGLDENHLRQVLSWEDADWHGTPAVKIPYPDEHNGDAQLRYRVGINSGDRFRWQRGSKPRLYGLWNLPSIKTGNFCVLVEGETDVATLTYHGIPCLGVPGASSFNGEWATRYLADIPQVFVWKEHDIAGEQLTSAVSTARPDAKVIIAPPEYKDPTQMAAALGDGFIQEFFDLMDQAAVTSTVSLTTPVTNHPNPESTTTEKEELRHLFPLPKDERGRTIQPEMRELAMLRRDNPGRGVSRLVVSNSWRNPTNRVYKLRGLFSFLRGAFHQHLAQGGQIYKTEIKAATVAPDDGELREAECKEWDCLRQRFHRAGALYRWLSVWTPDGASRVIFSSTPAFDGQAPLEDPVAGVLDVLRNVRPLGDPYAKRNAHGGPKDTWQPSKAGTGGWWTVGTRPAYALLEKDQDVHDQAAAAANGVTTWKATPDEVNARNPEIILATRHWEAGADASPDALLRLWESLGFSIAPRAWVQVECTVEAAGIGLGTT